ncbi:hypothetical protein WJX84_000584 [Apatococcus fuscideae]|uniref:Uncharacterized protein n=1 Tax=Apatococcus fuscideae TaxID=2026836 RepID=A0AAW1SWE8_9CHLO
MHIAQQSQPAAASATRLTTSKAQPCSRSSPDSCQHRHRHWLHTRLGRTRRPSHLQATKQRRALDPDQRPPKPSKPDTSSTPETLIAERDEVPEEVNARVLQRILIFAGVPVFTGILLLPLIVYLKTVQKWEIPNWAVLIVQTSTFGAGFFGISYGALSASWEPNREGSKLGFTEFKANLALALQDLRRRR